jgi:hypothetical protein
MTRLDDLIERQRQLELEEERQRPRLYQAMLIDAISFRELPDMAKRIPRWQDAAERMPMLGVHKHMQDEIDALRKLVGVKPHILTLTT